ncbi:PcfJ domain-containing protein [Yersinia intermedia]|uniref:PcfJ domain-containing protein n=1 Tax=Yersinia intermedia TaxID=631 RepID=UPI001CFCCC7A|nr:PcfJ domain-containing protein [Yersinia intermedia]MCB5315151.1 PcfJ domain-containing protein [Yersinia intermedia]
MHVINEWTCSSKILSLHDIFKICQKSGVFRLVKNEEDDNHIRIIICGTYRIQKNKKSGKVSMWCYKLKDKDHGVWYRRNFLPSNVHLFWSRRAAFDMDDWLRNAIKYIIKSLIEAGFSIDDKLYLYRIRASNGKSAFISTLIPSSVDEHSYHNDLFHSLGKIASFNYPNKVQHISKHELLEEIEKKIYNRVYKVIGVDNEFNASKALSKSIWMMVDKTIFTKYARASHCSMTYNSVRQAMFEDYLDFSKRICIADGADFGGLWPMVGRLRRQHKTGRFTLSGKSKELFEQLSFPYGISYADFKHLRHTRLSLVSALNNNHHESFKVISRLLRNPLVKNYPTQVIYWIIDYLEGRYYSERENDIYRVCSKWLEYHRDLFKNIGFRKHHIEPWDTSRWEMEKNQLCHAIDWLLNAEPIIHKNQEWPSFWRLSDEWTQQLRENATAVIKEWKGTGINWQTIDDSSSELITFDDLCNEGQEMEHCVASYAHWCASGKYLAISVSMDDERVTLGLSRTEHDVTYQFDQMRGIRNQAVSRNMLNKGKQILKFINTSLKN